MTPPILQAIELTKRFGPVKALDRVSFDLRPGEVHALCGENGAGKSTLIRTLSGVWPAGAFEGEILLEGRPARFRGPVDAQQAGIAVIHQEFALFPDLTVAENLLLGDEPLRYGLIEAARQEQAAWRLLQEIEAPMDPCAPVRELGVGQQQLVEIAKALRRNARILILDEPTAALSSAETDALLQRLGALRSRGISSIYISHKLDEVFRIADRITVLRDGGSVAALSSRETSAGELISLMAGRPVTEAYPRRRVPRGPARLSVRNLTVRSEFASRGEPRLADIGFDVHAGEVLGLGGLMGAGRTELLLHLMGAWGRRVCGEVRLDGRPLHADSPRPAWRAGLALVSEDRKRLGLHLDESIGFNLSLAGLDRYTNRLEWIDRMAERRANQQWFDALGIRAAGVDVPVATLSGGNQQKVVLGKSLHTQPRVVLLDEPTRGVDVAARADIYQRIQQLKADGLAVLLVSSELAELMGVSDRILMLAKGRLCGEFDPAHATADELLAAAMGRGAAHESFVTGVEKERE